MKEALRNNYSHNAFSKQPQKVVINLNNKTQHIPAHLTNLPCWWLLSWTSLYSSCSLVALARATRRRVWRGVIVAGRRGALRCIDY